MPRKPKYSRELCDKLLPLFKEGAAVVEVCQELGITRKTYYDWKDKYKEFKEAAELAEEAAETFFLKRGRVALFSNGKVKMDTALYCFTMKTRFGYRETDPTPSPDGAEKGQPLSISFNVVPAVGEVTVTNANTDA